MRRLGVALAGALVAVAAITSAQGSPLAKKVATVAVPRDGNATVAHLVLQATAKKGKKPKKAAKRPRLKVQKAPQGVVVAASYKRDAKNKNRWHATVVIVNPASAAPRRTSSNGSQDQEGNVVIVIETETEYIVVFVQVEIEEDVTFREMPVPPWMQMYCDPPGSSGDRYLYGMPTGDILPTEFLDYGCLLGEDGPTTGEMFMDLGLSGIVLDLDPFPGNPVEYVAEFAGYRIAPYNAIAITAPSGHAVTALLPPAGGYGATKSGTTATFGRADKPFAPNTAYQANIRYSGAFSADDTLTARFSYDFGQTWSDPYAVPFTP